MEPYTLTASQALAKFKNGSLTVETYARSLLSRIAERDADVQAWAHLDPDYVLEEAKKLDRIPAGARGPLHGVAFAVKDIFYTKDMPTQFNSPNYDGHVAELDASSVAILRRAGALFLGKATTAEFAATTAGPKTKNPHDPSRTPGGSSSGSAAAVGDFQAPVALATQTGGSTIRPASFNGIYGFKPTWNTISRDGVKIYALLFDTVGLYARSVEDLELLADVYNIQDDQPAPSPFVVKGAKIAVVKTMVWPQVGPGTARALETGAAILRKHGAEVQEVELPPEVNGLPQWHRTWQTAEGMTSFLAEYRTRKEGLSDFLVAQVENKNNITRADQVKAFDSMAAARPVVDELAGRYDAILTPSVMDEAPAGISSTGSAAFNGIWTALHMPVVNVPGFEGANGLPIGLSLVGPRYRDRHVLAVAKAVGEIFEAEGGWKRTLRRSS
ncbi:amidase [Niveomyces insectorum RCEF 264]|uniref:Amidase n=1 Tax=Niveomyces insectorum RCEF 264 TaxID=1081102 RepID=A0A167SIN9_9HYPO|nr:amidase [Niveomyces insectorum RCEF 264]